MPDALDAAVHRTAVLDLLSQAEGPVALAVWSLAAATAVTWTIIVLEGRRLQRWRVAEIRLDEAARGARKDRAGLHRIAARHPEAPASEALLELARSAEAPSRRLAAIEPTLVRGEQRGSRALSILATIASVAPFVGLFGTVWGILRAFMDIGAQGTTSLAVVAPAIGEALVVTAVGLFVAIPAAAAQQLLLRAHDDLHARTRALVGAWAHALGTGVEGEDTVRDGLP